MARWFDEARELQAIPRNRDVAAGSISWNQLTIAKFTLQLQRRLADWVCIPVPALTRCG
jgi:hypothetical protein